MPEPSRREIAERCTELDKQNQLLRSAVRFLLRNPAPVAVSRLYLTPQGEHYNFYPMDLGAAHGGFLLMAHHIPQPDGQDESVQCEAYYLDDLDEMLRDLDNPASRWFRQFAAPVAKAKRMRDQLAEFGPPEDDANAPA